MSFSIDGKTAIITGAAHGCGLAIGRHFLDAGANVVFADIDGAALEKELGDTVASNDKARIFPGDLCQKLTVANLLSHTVDAFDQIDILVNAARQIRPSDPLQPDADMVEEMLRQNLYSALRLTQTVAKHMIRESEGQERSCNGAIINLSTIAARRAQPELLGFSISNAALDQMTRAMAVSLAPHRIRVNGVAFGSVMSASLQTALRSDDTMRRQILDRTPLNRIAAPKELSDTVQYLASDAAAFVTGQIVTVDGGRTLIDPVIGAAH